LFFAVSRGSAALSRAAQPASSASVPRLISSWILVSSRHTTAGRSSPCEAATLAGLEEDLGATVAGQLGEAPGALALAARREPLEAEPVGGQPRDGQRGRHRRRARHGGHSQAGRGRSRDEPVAGIADPRRARVGDEQDVPAGLELAEEFGGAARLDRVVVGHDPGGELDVQARGQPAHPAGVLGRDQGGPGQFGHQPRGGVLGPADGNRGQRQHAAIVPGLAA
jgi:hypothetical protein